jgi:methanol--5-hydroxybenzimidazolylcobamide Co-methyltransferase
MGQEKNLRDMYMFSDRFRGPEGYVLSYDNAYKIGESIVSNGDSHYLRAKAAALTSANLVNEAYSNGTLQLTISQKDMLKKMIKVLSSLPDEEDKFIQDCVQQYSAEVKAFNPKNYDL